MTFTPTAKQRAAQTMLSGAAMHNMLFGGSRSGKTFWLCRSLAVRAARAERSRHLIARWRFNHIKASIWRDTWPKMMGLCFPALAPHVKYNESELFCTLPNKSEIWFGGLDDKERVDKILGNEYATIYLNECSQISALSRETIVTRLAQKNENLRLRMYYDCNPPAKTHWTYRLFVQKRQPEPPYAALGDPDNYASMQLNPGDNAANLDAAYLSSLDALGARARRRFRDGEFGDAGENALWTYEGIERHRVKGAPELQRVVVAVDPSGASGKEDERSDHIGIVVGGLGLDGDAYVLEDLTVKGGPALWGRVAVMAYSRHQADCLVGETNFGGGMVEHVVRTAARDSGIEINYKEVTASRGKTVRAEPISALAEQGRVHHVGRLPDLEDQLCAWTNAGYTGDRSPDRGDAYVWAMTELFPGLMRKDPAKEPDWFASSARASPGSWLL